MYIVNSSKQSTSLLHYPVTKVQLFYETMTKTGNQLKFFNKIGIMIAQNASLTLQT